MKSAPESSRATGCAPVWRAHWLAFALFVSLAVGGCSTGFHARRVETTTSTQLLSAWRKDTTNHLVYMGSDARYHYVLHCQLGRGRSYRVPRSAWHLQRTFPLGHHDNYVLHRADFPPVR